MGAKSATRDFLLTGGLVVDGTGRAPFTGHLLVRDGVIRRIAEHPIRTDAVAIDCRGKVVAPGFIDVHSHLDWRLPIRGHAELKAPALGQGITTVVAGNCGFSIAGLREATAHRARVEGNLFNTGLMGLSWNTVADCRAALDASGLAMNLALLAGHGSTRTSIRGFDPSPLHPYESAELLRLLALALDQGAAGISLGLQYEPGIHASPEEISEVAKLAAARGKTLAVHLRAYSALSPAWPVRLLGEPHNLRALREVLDLARRTGVRLQVSHLIFVGTRTWRTAETALRLIDGAIADGIDVRFDTNPHHCGISTINVIMPAWFLARLPGAWEDRGALRRLRRQLLLIERLLGFGPRDVQIADARCEEYESENGRFLAEIARRRRRLPVDALIDIARASAGKARVLLHRYGNPRIVEELVRHRASLFMTNAWVEPSGVQNPAAWGAFPRFLQLCRDRSLLSLQEVVHRMTGAAAARFGIRDRGILAEKMAADIVVFDWEKVRDNTAPEATDAPPDGIVHVFVNGIKAWAVGRAQSPLKAGRTLAL